ncbi:unnamed protein product [Ciceribacter selenitireducens ATCC BAA-1503]|uniref:Uncharacterized protein n=1 Tax=Ciceribacter selenitireducens ATCC BAA-1503 TaxID=1336235 RepID=A0A376AG05_9HYPH|nr:unnamed protein product [Ciceribacter selenitireducens ATCC BAA-1503]
MRQVPAGLRIAGDRSCQQWRPAQPGRCFFVPIFRPSPFPFVLTVAIFAAWPRHRKIPPPPLVSRRLPRHRSKARLSPGRPSREARRIGASRRGNCPAPSPTG